MRKGFRAVALVATVALVAGAFFAVPAEAAKKKKKKAAKCTTFVSGMEEAKEVPVVAVSAKATEKAPVKIEFEHGMAGPTNPVTGDDLLNEWMYFNIQVTGAGPGLYILEEFSDRHDIDLYLYDGAGEEVASSGGFNAAPVDAVIFDFSSDGNAGTNYESISGLATSTCTGYTIGSDAYLTNGTAVTISLWLGEAQAAEE